MKELNEAKKVLHAYLDYIEIESGLVEVKKEGVLEINKGGGFMEAVKEVEAEKEGGKIYSFEVTHEGITCIVRGANLAQMKDQVAEMFNLKVNEFDLSLHKKPTTRCCSFLRP